MKTLLFCFKGNLKITFALLLLAFLNDIRGQGFEIQGDGIIRINLLNWKYNPDPHTVGSIERLGKSQTYFVFVYSAEFIKDRYKTNVESIKLVGKPGAIVSTNNLDKLAFVALNGARSLIEPENYEKAISLFENGGGLRIIIGNPRPPYVDIPVPSGRYFLTYAVHFPNALHDYDKFVCPFYGSKSCAYDKLWGPSSVDVNENNVTEIEFTPEPLCWTYTETDLLDFNKSWENSSVFWDYVDYLSWAGEIF